MKVINVPEMHCQRCVERISEALTNAGIAFEISLSEKTVKINDSQECISKTIALLDDLGFSAK